MFLIKYKSGVSTLVCLEGGSTLTDPAVTLTFSDEIFAYAPSHTTSHLCRIQEHTTRVVILLFDKW